MHISDFFKIFDYSTPGMEKVGYFVSERDYVSAKRELLNYFVNRKKLNFSKAEPIEEKDKNFPLSYISRHFILSGPNEGDSYLSSMFLSPTNEYTTMDVLPFIKNNLSFMIMSRQKESQGALFYSPSSIFPPFIHLTLDEGREIKVYPSKYAYVSTKSPDEPLFEEDIYEIAEESSCIEEPFGMNTGRCYLAFDFSGYDLSLVSSARFCAKITLPPDLDKKELLFFNICDSSWDNTLTWDKIKGNVYSWENSPAGPFWSSPAGSDSEYLNVICRFWFARPMAYQYLSDVEKNAVYGERLLMMMDAFSKQKEGGFNRVLETGERLSNFTCVLHALVDTPCMTADYLVSVLSMMYRDMEHLMNNPDLGWSNWAVVRTCGLSKAIDFLPELKKHREWKISTRNLLDSLFGRMYSSDFSFREAGLAYSFWCVDLFASAYNSSVMNNDPFSAFTKNRLEKVFDASLDFIYPNFYDTNIGDSNYASKKDYLLKAGKTFPTKKLKAFLSGTDDRSISLSKCYVDSASVIMRNSFEKDKAMYLALLAMPYDGHAHEDLNNLIFYGFSRPLLTDSGRYGYSQSEISSHLKKVCAHNTIEIEGSKYSSHSEGKGEILTFKSNELFDFAVTRATISTECNAVHTRSVLFMKKEGFAIVNDIVTNDESARKFKQNWHFMPDANLSYDFNNHVKTAFSDGGNIALVCPCADLLECDYDTFSSGYGMAQENSKASFVKHGKDVSMTTLLLPFKGEDIKISASTVDTEDTINGCDFVLLDKKGLFLLCNGSLKAKEYAADCEMAFIYDETIHMTNCKCLTHSSKVIIESPTPIGDISVTIKSGIVEIESASLTPSTKREEAVRIYSPKTTHVILNGQMIPFTLYSDYVFAVKAI